MSLQNKILEDIKTALKNKDAQKLKVLRFLQADIKNKEIQLRPQKITESDILNTLQKSLKQREEIIVQLKQAGRAEGLKIEKEEMNLLRSYLPAMPEPKEVEKVVHQVLSELSATSLKEMGKVMKECMKHFKGPVDKKLLSDTVRQKLN